VGGGCCGDMYLDTFVGEVVVEICTWIPLWGRLLWRYVLGYLCGGGCCGDMYLDPFVGVLCYTPYPTIDMAGCVSARRRREASWAWGDVRAFLVGMLTLRIK
jgi:hypothetical protein